VTKQADALHIPSLDGLRAFAIAVVFVAHAGLSRFIPGHFGVTVFFFLSGFLITTLLRIEFEKTGAVSIRNFYLRRVLRIFPPFYLVLLLATALTVAGPLGGPPLSLEGLGAQVFYLTNYWVVAQGWWAGHAPGTWIFWSLAVEEHFYLFFPLLYLLLLRLVPSRRRQALVLLGLCALVLAWRCVLVFHFHTIKERTYIATDTRIDSILFGCVLAVLANPVLDRPRFSDDWWKFIALPFSVLALLLSLAIRDPWFQQSVAYTIQGVALAPVFVVAIRFPGWLAFAVLNWGWVRFLGVLSYSLYLLHTTVLFGVDRYLPAPELAQGVAGGLVSVGLAVGIYYAVEKPAARLRRRLSRTGARPQPVPPLPVRVVAGAREP
jgi:peptidoglycan/LPS O-acetylase OafA/YrhL